MMTREVQSGPEPSPPAHPVDVIRDYLQAHLADRVTLAELARATGLTDYAVLRGFRRATGIPPELMPPRIDSSSAGAGASIQSPNPSPDNLISEIPTMPSIHLLIAIAVTPILAGPHAVPGGTSPSTASRPSAVTYSAEVRFDLRSATIEVDAVLHLAAHHVRSGVAELLLNAGLEILELSGPGVGPYAVEPSTFASDWNLVTVQVTGPSAEAAALPIRIRYRGVPRLPSDGINTISPEWVELSLDSQWFPVVASLDQEMTGEVLLRLPPSWLVVASGDVRRTGDAHLLRIEVPQVDVAFSAGPQLALEVGERFTVVSRVADPRTSRIVLAAAEDCTRYFHSLASDAVRFPGGRIVLAGREGPGYARENYIVLSEVDTVHVDRLHAFLCHETFHYWTRSAGARSPDHWMVEAFAEYAAGRFLGAHYGPDHFEGQRSRWEVAGRDQGPVWTPALTGRPSFQVMYRRAPYLLARLEARIGAERFDRLLRRFMAEGIQRTPDLLEAVAAVAGREHAEWFRAELGATG